MAMNAEHAVEVLIEALDLYRDENDEDEIPLRRVDSFEDVGILTTDAGLVLTMKDGSEFQITVVQSREGRQ
jgi:hypothetical protein